MTLGRFFTNPFDDQQISLADLLAFATDHLQRLIANNPGGALDARITETRSALEQVQNSDRGDFGTLGQRKARKLALRTFRKKLPPRLGKIVAAVVAAYGPQSKEVTECCPGGRTLFQRCNDDALAGHLEVLIAGLTAHQADLGPAVIAEATALLTEWTALHAASEASTGSKAATEAARREARLHLQLMLYLNLHHLALLHPRQPARLNLYMQESLLRNPKRRVKE